MNTTDIHAHPATITRLAVLTQRFEDAVHRLESDAAKRELAADDHEVRIRELEKNQRRLMGAAAVVGAVLASIGGFVLYLLDRMHVG